MQATALRFVALARRERIERVRKLTDYLGVLRTVVFCTEDLRRALRNARQRFLRGDFTHARRISCFPAGKCVPA